MFRINARQSHLRLLERYASWIIGVISLLVVLLVFALLLPRGTNFQLATLTRADVAWLPRLNAGLNATNVILLSAAYLFIRRRQIERHRFCMLTALGLSILFLLSYVIYHAIAGSTPFTGPNMIRPIYFAILISHIILAALVPPLALTTLYHAWRGTFTHHRRIGRWALPVWLYVSASGVVVYLFLYMWN